jgi:hypothetical protein
VLHQVWRGDAGLFLTHHAFRVPHSAFALFTFLLLSAVISPAASLSISSLTGPVTSSEINSFITYMQSQSPPPTPWGALTGTGHNDWADGTGGRDL